MERIGRTAVRTALWLLLAAALLAALYFGSAALGRRAGEEALSLTRESVQRAALQCYALEGSYPASLAYLTEHYGLRLDERRYFVDYRFVGSNLMPEITVLPVPSGN